MTETTDRSPQTLPAHTALHAAGMNQGMRVLSYLLGGVLGYGFLGWLGDHLLGTGFLLPTGIILGAGLAIYVIIRRFGETTDGEIPSRTERYRTTLQRRSDRRQQGAEQRVGRS
jgi:ATP synthase protein I